MQSSKNDVWVGLFVMLGAVAVLFLALKAANLLTWSFDEDYQVTAKFDNIGGLKPGAAVKSAGVVVGRVKKIEFDGESFQAKVTLALQTGLGFPQDSSLKILTSGLLGEQYLDVSPGADEKMLVAGDKIGSTQSAVILENLISQFLYSQAGKPAAESNKP
jgi:phospholipid/cholesterol/gamma-HCH transport system substrate-binding protein